MLASVALTVAACGERDLHRPEAPALRTEPTAEALELTRAKSTRGAPAAPTAEPSPSVPLPPPAPVDAAALELASIAELYARAAELDGKLVSLAGDVVKVNARIRGTNWIHLQDGSGEAAQGTHDLTVTSAALPALGERVVVTGVASVGFDPGMGSRYPVVLLDVRIDQEEPPSPAR